MQQDPTPLDSADDRAPSPREDPVGAAHLQMAFGLCGIGLWQYCLARHTLWWDAVTRRIHGVSDAYVPSVEEAIDFYAPEARQLIREAVETALHAGTEFSLDLPLVRQDSQRIWVRAHVRALRKDGRIVGAWGTFQDITELRDARDRAEAAEQRLLDAIAVLPDAFVLYDSAERLVVCNERYRKINALRPADVRPGTPFEAIVRRGVTSGLYPQALGREEVWLAERLRQFRAPPAEPVEMQLAGGRWVQAVDGVTREGGRVGLRTDITALKRQQAALVAARQKAEAADEAKSRLLANVSHEIRTPLAGVIGMLDLLLADPHGSDNRARLQLARDSAQHLLGTLSDLLDLSKMDAEVMTLKHERYDLRALVQDICALFRDKALSQGLWLECQVDEALPAHVLGDRQRLRQVLNNLVSNAVKFTQAGGVTVSVRRGGAAAAPEVQIDVVDTGIGLPDDAQHTLFARFAQAKHSDSKHFGGTGLGLAISKQLVELMGGRIGAKNRVEGGSHFWLALPLREAVAQTEPAHATVTPASPPLPKATLSKAPAAKPLRILAAEDNRVNQMVVRGFLEPQGYAVEIAEDGEAACAAAEHRAFDVILMDIQMPKLDGVEATKRIRAGDGPNRATPIVALTANALEGDRERYLAAGMNAHVAKPIDAEMLVGMVQSLAALR